eukprot:GHUV01019663.1.p1 GENE.GHUV01019663.1~~GHUV01019663.1.p1  ORF type:complete len:312 (-),score=90.32 GHUV01019663.1:669-1604(-)
MCRLLTRVTMTACYNSDACMSAADVLHGGRVSKAHVLTAPIQLSLTTGLALLSKQHSSSCYSPGPGSSTGKGGDQLLPIIQKFLESLPSVGKAWSFDAASTVHAAADARQDNDSNSCCSCNSEITVRAPPRLPRPQAVRRQSRRRTFNSATRPAKLHVSPPPAVPGHLLLLSTPVGESSSYQPVSCSNVARSLHFAESTGSAPTPSLLKTATDPAAQPASSNGTCSRRGVFVGNLPGGVDERALVELFSPCGRIDKLWIARNAANQASLGYGFVVFDASSGHQAAQCAERLLDGTTLQQQHICVRVSTRDF